MFVFVHFSNMPVIPMHIRERVKALFLVGRNSNEIQQEVGHTRSAILNICRKVTCGLGIENEPRTGRGRILSARAMRNIVIHSKQNPFLTAREIRIECNLSNTVSVDTVKRVLRENKLFGRVTVKKTKLNRIHKRKRLAFCFERKQWTPMQWTKIIFSDESTVELFLRQGSMLDVLKQAI